LGGVSVWGRAFEFNWADGGSCDGRKGIFGANSSSSASFGRLEKPKDVPAPVDHEQVGMAMRQGARAIEGVVRGVTT